MKPYRLISFSLAAVLLAAGSASAQRVSYGMAPHVERDPELRGRAGVVNKLGTVVPLDQTFYDHNGKPVVLKDCVGGKPTILVLAYYTCPKLCTEVLNGLVVEMRKMARDGYECGRDYHVVTVSINPMDSSPFAFKKRRSYLDELDKRPDTEEGWWFLTASHGQGTNVVEAYRQIRTLADAVGFEYVPENQKSYDDAAELAPAAQEAALNQAVRRTKDYVHPSVLTFLTPEGKVARYLQGLAPEDYGARDVKFGLVEAGDGKFGSFVDRAAMLCFTYDQHSLNGRYKLGMNALAAVAAPFPIIIGLIVYFTWRKSRRERVLVTATVGETK